MPTKSFPHHGRSSWLSVGCRALKRVVDAEMVLQIGADMVVCVQDGDAETLQAAAGSDA